MTLRRPTWTAPALAATLLTCAMAQAQSPAVPAVPANPVVQAAPTAPTGVVPRPTVAAEPSPATAAPAAAPAPAPAASGTETGLAAVYSDKLHGRRTANGERYDRNKLTTAHKTLPFGTMVRVTNVKNRKSVILRVNDRGPTQPERVLDISPRAAKAIGIHPRGMAQVTVQVTQPARSKAKSTTKTVGRT